MLDIGTLHPDPQDGAGGAVSAESPATIPGPFAQLTTGGSLSDALQPGLGDASAPPQPAAAGPVALAMALGRALQSVLPAAIFRRILIELFNTTPPSKPTPGIGHNSGETEPLDPAPTPPQQQPPNPLPGAVGAAAALSQQGPNVPATPSGFTTLAEESKFGGHGYANHVNTTIAEAERWVLKRANSRRYGIRGTQRRGVFNSAAEADRLIADVLAAHPDIVRQVVSGALNQAELMMQFSKPTGIEASAKGTSSVATISLTYGVKLVLRHLHGNSRGSYILTAFPANKTP